MMTDGIRFWLWQLVRRQIPLGCLLPRWAVCVRTVLFPIDTFYWWMSGRTGYDVCTDTWLIHGVRYSDQSLRALGGQAGACYRIRRLWNLVIFEPVPDARDREETR